MTDPHTDVPAQPLNREQQIARDAARRALYEALRDAGQTPLEVPGRANNPSITIRTAHTTGYGSGAWWLTREETLPAHDPEGRIQQVLQEQGIDARARIDEMSLWLTVTSTVDAERLTELVTANITPVRRAALRLGEVLTRAGITPGTAADEARVRIGPLELPDALRLLKILGAGPVEQFSLEDMDWGEMEKLADELMLTLERASGARVVVDADPGCRTCSRPDQVVVGSLETARAHQLADRIEQFLKAEQAQGATR
ncbi:hypothetical protein QWJ26_13500 [Streptomyces sp. CSDS2]|uniref:hypothetical protein n=1 Tax=Streptomyces sp. CSDS2 TaxID=3055051 RepID=UPI0025B176BB|nr:hypothetical protein [Streptomyces sp. CSDS2]MDN3260811.1 hypothetical protein [Streptomyces sp. CSDS2]